MIKQTFSKLLMIGTFVALMLALPSAHINAATMDVNQPGIKELAQSEALLLMAQGTETRRSVTTSTSEAPAPMEESRSVITTTTEAPPPTEDRRSVTTSTSSTKTAAEAPPQKPHCTNQCRDQYDRSMAECNLPDHPHHKKCEKWAKEREKECLEKCYRQ